MGRRRLGLFYQHFYSIGGITQPPNASGGDSEQLDPALGGEDEEANESSANEEDL